MTFYLIGLGLNEKSISVEALEICKKADKIYLENYTIDFPYKISALEKIIGKKIEKLEREIVEKEKFVEDAEKKDIVFLVYGSPLAATTHISLILKCNKEKIPYKILQNTSILDVVAETGLQLYKFGKTASMPKWSDNHQPDSFTEFVRENEMIGAHSLILCDIGLSLRDAIEQLQEVADKIKFEKILVCSCLGTKDSKIIYDEPEVIKNKKLKNPFCIILPGKLHFLEEEMLEKF